MMMMMSHDDEHDDDSSIVVFSYAGNVFCVCLHSSRLIFCSFIAAMDRPQQAPAKSKSKRRPCQKIAAAVLTVCGTTGLVLQCPKLVESEGHHHVALAWSANARARRAHLGPTALPVGTGCDNMVRDKNLINGLVRSEFPELVALVETEGGSVDTVHLKGEDLTHALKRVTRTMPKRLSSDHGPASKALQDVMFRCKISGVTQPRKRTTTFENYNPAPSQENLCTFYEKLTESSSRTQDIGDALRAVAENRVISPDFKQLFVDMIETLGEKEFRRFMDANDFDEGQAPRFQYAEIVRNLRMNVDTFCPDTPYESQDHFRDELSKVARWYERDRSRDKKVGLDVSKQFADTFDQKFSQIAARYPPPASSGGAALAQELSDHKENKSSNKGVMSSALTKKAVARLGDPELLTCIMNNRFGSDDQDLGSQFNEIFHAFLKKRNLGAGRGGKKSLELAEMQMDYARMSYNDTRLNGWLVRGRVSGDVRHFQQIELMRRSGAMVLRGHFDNGTLHKSLFAAIEGQTVPRKTVEQLQQQGFKVIARAGAAWSQVEVHKLEDAMRAVAQDPTLMGDYANVEKWVSWVVLGGSRTANEVARKMNQLLGLRTDAEEGEESEESEEDDEEEEDAEEFEEGKEEASDREYRSTVD